MRYSPLPMDAYRLEGVAHDELSAIVGAPYEREAWNLFWLSTPAIDSVPGTGPEWFRFYAPTQGLLARLIRDIGNDEGLRTRLGGHPLAFAEWFEDQPATDYLSSSDPLWAQTVVARAKAASDRILREIPPFSIKP